MRHLCLTAALAVLVACPGVRAAELEDASGFVEGFLAHADHGRPVPSAAFVLVRDRQVLALLGSGHADAARTQPVDPERTVFRAASISKVFTATAAMQLVEQGKLALDADVNSYLTRFKLDDAFGAPVTLENLLTHTAGFEDRFTGDLALPGKQIPLADYFASHVPRRAIAPGEQVSYSNHGMALAGYLVETVSGEPFDSYMTRHVLEPLGMNHSTFRQPPPGDWQLADSRFDGRPPPRIVFNPYPAATLQCTAADMGRFLIAHLNGGQAGDESILQPRSIAQMQRQHWTAVPGMPGVGYGWFESFGNGRRAVFHTGDSGHHSLLYLMPAERIGFFLVYAGSDDAASIREEFVQAFLDRYFPAPPFVLPAPDPSFASRASEFTGLYQGSRYSRGNFEKLKAMIDQARVADGRDGTLVVEPPGSGKVKLVAISPDLFRSDEGGYVGFRRDAGGRIRTLTVSGSVWDPGGWERIPWYRSGRLHLGLLVCAFVLLALRAVAWPIVGLTRRLRKRPVALDERAAARRAWRISGVASWLALLAPVLAGVVALATLRPPITGVPIALVVFLALALGSVILGLALAPFVLLAWRGSYWTLPRRIHFTLVAAAACALAAILLQYNLLGFRF